MEVGGGRWLLVGGWWLLLLVDFFHLVVVGGGGGCGSHGVCAVGNKDDATMFDIDANSFNAYEFPWC